MHRHYPEADKLVSVPRHLLPAPHFLARVSALSSPRCSLTAGISAHSLGSA